MLRILIKRIPGIVALKRALCLKFLDFTRLNLPRAFPLFAPNSSGRYHPRAALTIQSVNQTMPALSAFAASIGLHRAVVEDVECVAWSEEERKAAADLKKILDASGSDKGDIHKYHLIYGAILKNRAGIRSTLEIGLGTNHPDVVSNMGDDAKPGASLRAFRDFLPNAQIYGADIDRRILFAEERIKTFFVDQCDPATFTELTKSLPAELDLIIDDGLHSPNANTITMTFALPLLKVGGWFIVEDIAAEALPYWETVSAMLPARYECHCYKTLWVLVFAVKRLA